jgi:cyclophilin family peptidyl-prolyl cis-trans isomerase
MSALPLRTWSVVLAVSGLAACNNGGSSSQAGAGGRWSSPPAMQINPAMPYSADLVTDSGTIQVKLFASESPNTVNNFVFLARQHFYDGTIFHRVISGFMIQGGDPQGTGAGGPGYSFPDELPPKHPYAPGIVCMANAGPNTNGSQFFICSGTGCNSLPPSYVEFGTVTGGQDVVNAIANAPVGPSASGEMSSPKTPVHVKSVTITGP